MYTVAGTAGRPLRCAYPASAQLRQLRLGRGARELLPVERRASTLNNEAFPGAIECWPGADSPAIYVVSNIPGGGPDAEPVIAGGQHWHTDIELEPVPLSTSLFSVHTVPTPRDQPGGTWVTNPPREAASTTRTRRRNCLRCGKRFPSTAKPPMPTPPPHWPRCRPANRPSSTRRW